MPCGVRPATASNPTITSKRLGMATARPSATTSLASAEPVRRCRKTRRSMARPTSGASTNTDSTRAGTIAHSHSVRAWKYIAAEM